MSDFDILLAFVLFASAYSYFVLKDLRPIIVFSIGFALSVLTGSVQTFGVYLFVVILLGIQDRVGNLEERLDEIEKRNK